VAHDAMSYLQTCGTSQGHSLSRNLILGFFMQCANAAGSIIFHTILQSYCLCSCSSQLLELS
jgi:hypothetical protein